MISRTSCQRWGCSSLPIPVHNHWSQLSLAIPPWAGTLNTSKSCKNRYNIWCRVISQCQLLSDYSMGVQSRVRNQSPGFGPESKSRF